MKLQKLTGPECQRCGCNGTELIGAGGESRPWARFRCRFCLDEFTVGTDPTSEKDVNGVIFRPVRCPKCKSKRVPVHTTRRRKRYHKCENCGQPFSSVEV